MKLKSLALLALGFLAGAAVHFVLSNTEIEVWHGVFDGEDEDEDLNGSEEDIFDEGEPLPGADENADGSSDANDEEAEEAEESAGEDAGAE